MEKYIVDMRNAASRGRISLEEQVRAYDLLDGLLAADDMGCPCGVAAEEFCQAYVAVEAELAGCFDAGALQQEADALLVPLKAEMEELRFAAASAASLHLVDIIFSCPDSCFLPRSRHRPPPEPSCCDWTGWRLLWKHRA